MTDATNPDDIIENDIVEEVETDQEQDGIDDQAEETDEADLDGDEDDDGSLSDNDEADDDYETVTRGDKEYKVPKALKNELLMQEDYTRKTQMHSEEVKRFEERVTAFQNASEESVAAAVEVKQISDRLNDLKALSEQDWQYIRQLDLQNGTDEYGRLFRELNTLPTKLSEAQQKSEAIRESVLKQQSEIQTKQFEQGQAILARDIPGWGPELGAKLVDFVSKEFGVTEEKHGAAFMDPALVKMAYAAYKNAEAARKVQTKNRAEAVTKTKPVPTVKGSSSPKMGVHDGLSVDDWIERRNRQLSNKKAR